MRCCGDAPCLACLERAEGLRAPGRGRRSAFADGQVWLAVALGYEARIIGPVQARLHNYPGQAKDELDAALRSIRKSPLRSARWAAGISRSCAPAAIASPTGSTVRRSTRRRRLRRRVQRAPDNLSVRYQYALSLSGYDPDRFRHEVDDAFARVAKLKPATAYETVAQHRAAELAALLRKVTATRSTRACGSIRDIRPERDCPVASRLCRPPRKKRAPRSAPVPRHDRVCRRMRWRSRGALR